MVAWPRSRRVVATMVTLSAWTLFQALTRAAEPSGVTVEHQTKAAFLLNFAKFVDWPEKSFTAPDAPFVVGVLGDHPVGNLVAETVRGESVRGRRLEFRFFPSIMQNFESAHLLFISRSEKHKLATIFKELKGVPVLTVGETDGFTQSGGMINFVVVGTNVHFEINPEPAKRVGLTISSKLLDLPKANKARADGEAQSPFCRATAEGCAPARRGRI